MNYIVFDLEWNQPEGNRPMIVGNTALRSEIIQIGAVKLDENLDELSDFCVTVAPEYITRMNTHVQDLTGITQTEIDSGIQFEQAIEQFRSWCGNDFCLCSWSNTDISVLCENLNAHHLDLNWIPKAYDIQKLFDLQITHQNRAISLLDALEYLNEDAYDAHDALNDAANTVTIMWYLDLEEMESCLIRSGLDFSAYYIRSDDFATRYVSTASAISDWSIKTFISPENGKKVSCSDWIYASCGNYISLAADSTGAEYFVSLSLKKCRSGSFRASRKIYTLNSAFRHMYNSLANDLLA